MTEIKTEYGSFTVQESTWGGSVTYQNVTGGEVDVYSPEWDEPDSYEIEIRTERMYLDSAERAEEFVGLLRFAGQLAELLREATEGSRKEAEKIRAEREAEEERKEQERQQALRDREERLMMEFVGETVKIRERGYKTARIATVEAYQRERYDYDKREYVKDEEYSLKFVYSGDQRTQSVNMMQRMDIKVGASWETLWDDGTDDIGGPEYLAGSAKPTGKMYDQRRQEDY